MFKQITLSAFASLALLAPSFAQEEQAPEAAAPVAQEPAQEPAKELEALLKNVPSLLDKKWKGAMTVTSNDEESGNNSKVDVEIQFQDLKHFKANIKVHSVMPEFEMEQNLDLQILCDGEFLYVDGTGMEDMGIPFPMPIKCKMSVLERMIAMSAPDLEVEGEEANLKDFMRTGMKEMFKELDIKEEGSEEGKRRFVMSNEDGKGHIVFDAKHWIPQEMQIEAEGTVVKMTTRDTGIVEAFPEGTFVFKVPEGKNVTDLTVMLESQLPQEGGDEDLEF